MNCPGKSIYSFIYSFIIHYSFIHSFIHSFNYLFIPLFIYSFIYSVQFFQFKLFNSIYSIQFIQFNLFNSIYSIQFNLFIILFIHLFIHSFIYLFISKLDCFSEQEILRDEIRSLQSMRNRLKMRVDELEAEVKALRDEIENARKAAKSEEEVSNSFFSFFFFCVKGKTKFFLHWKKIRRMCRCRNGNVSPESKWRASWWRGISTRNAGWNSKKP